MRCRLCLEDIRPGRDGREGGAGRAGKQRGAISGSGCHDYGMVGRQATLDSRPGRSRGMTSGIKSQCANTGRRAVLRQGSQRDGQCPRVYLVTRLPPLYPCSVLTRTIAVGVESPESPWSPPAAPPSAAFVPLPALGDRLCAAKLDHSNFGLFGLRPASAAMDLTTAYRYNQNMMEYYTCKSKSFYWVGGRAGGRESVIQGLTGECERVGGGRQNLRPDS
ncbi:hypothetical protein E2C01_001467 [Portunus trituberculatus]|uniref:Uncharacterized protein n=1 Tax=Portunus trituberculatus TaxID=210409 RepID=A0A5B7CGQ3_PORTR|nr:hypothetical protein [Portunus trituberculatus]